MTSFYLQCTWNNMYSKNYKNMGQLRNITFWTWHKVYIKFCNNQCLVFTKFLNLLYKMTLPCTIQLFWTHSAYNRIVNIWIKFLLFIHFSHYDRWYSCNTVKLFVKNVCPVFFFNNYCFDFFTWFICDIEAV